MSRRINLRLPVWLFVATLVGCGEDRSAETQTRNEAPAEPTAPAASPADHVSFFVLGKSWHFNQNHAGELEPVDMGFFAEIFKTAGGEVADAFMQRQAPGSEPIPFDRQGDGGAVLYGHDGNRHQSIAAVDAELPNGDYAFSFTTPAGEVDDYVVTLGGADGETDLPPAPVITLEQNGARARADAVAPGTDLRVSWTPFTTGGADPNGIADDLIFVMMQDCHGNRAFHSGRPLNTPNPLQPDKPSATVLTFADDEITIPGEALVPGMRYMLDVEHARLLDTDEREGIVGMTTFAVTTHLPVQASGDPDANECPADRP